MKLFIQLFALGMIELFVVPAFGHGMDKPGPHGGAIQMPGAFHTEVLASSESFDIYLLDMDFKNPTIKDSAILTAWIQSGKIKTNLTCKAIGDHFQCDNPKKIAKGDLVLKAKRENSVGNEAQYSLPLPSTAKQ